MQCAIRHPEKVRKVVVISARFRHDGAVKEALDALPQLTAEAFKGSPIETEYKKLSPTPNEFPNFVKHLLAAAAKIEIGHIAPDDTRHPDAAHGRHRPDGERLFRCQAAKAMRRLNSS
jgi:hypothetical protein